MTLEEMRVKRELVATAKEEGCKRCGEKNPIVLQFHHRDRRTKVGTITQLLAQGTVPGLQMEIEKCDVLCANCHLIVEKEFREDDEAYYAWRNPAPTVECNAAAAITTVTRTPRRSRAACAEILFTALSKKRWKIRDRFRRFISVDGNNCWLWLGACSTGRPTFTIECRPITALHVACAIEKGIVPGKKSKMSCGKVLCINPEHVLDLGTGTIISDEPLFSLGL